MLDALLIYLILTKLDIITAREWKKERTGNEISTLDDLKLFLNSRADLLETLEFNDKTVNKSKHVDKLRIKSFLVQGQKCTLCNEVHKLATCKKFLELSFQKRATHLKNARLFFNYMKSGHFLKECKAGSCKQCSEKHNTLLHFEKPFSDQAPATEDSKISSVLCSHNQSNSHTVLLATASVLITDNKGKRHKLRTILDPV